jgi:hypothetical protein
VTSAYAGTLLAGLLVLPLGATLAFAGATVVTVRSVPDELAGRVSGVLNAAMETGPTLGLAAFVSLAGAHTSHLTALGRPAAQAATAGYAFAFTIGGVVLAVLAVLAGGIAMTRRRTRLSEPNHGLSRRADERSLAIRAPAK